MTDTHCHLSLSQYNNDRDAVREKAGIVGVRRIINPGTDLQQSRAAVALAGSTSGVSPSTPEVYAAVGVHPQDVGGLTDDVFAEITKLAQHPRVTAIGEVGLELHHRASDLAPQKEWLARFMDLAAEVGKPLIFHVRSAHAEFRNFLERAWGPAPPKLPQKRRGVVHCFSGTLDDARWYTVRGLFLGITGIVTFPNAEGLRVIVREIPLEHLLLETDAPFLAPQSRRGKRNEPAYLREIAEQVAELKGVTVAEVERVTDENATRLFGL